MGDTCNCHDVSKSFGILDIEVIIFLKIKEFSVYNSTGIIEDSCVVL